MIGLGADRTIARWDAAHGIGDATIPQAQTIVGAFPIMAFGESELQKGGVKQITGPITGEGASGGVRAPEARREADD